MRIKGFRKGIIKAGILSGAIFLLTACNKLTTTIPVVTSSSSIGVIVKNATNLTILDSALSKSGVLLILDSAGPTAPYTLFTPPDISFQNAGITGFTIYGDSVAYLKRLVLYHLLSGVEETATIIATNLMGPNAPYAASSTNPLTGYPDTLYFTVNANGIFVNGNLLTQTNVMASNGVIHVISGVLIPPVGNIWQTLSNDSTLYHDTTLTYLVTALIHASSGTSNLDSLLSGTQPYTFFAPMNSAFRNPPFNFLNEDTINTINPDTLAALLKRHIVMGRYFTSDFNPLGAFPSLLQGDSINFSPYYANVILQKADSTATGVYLNPSNVTNPNILTTNGVIHKIDQVLYP